VSNYWEKLARFGYVYGATPEQLRKILKEIIMSNDSKITKNWYEGRVYNDENASFYEWRGLADDSEQAKTILIMECGRINTTWTPDEKEWRIEIRPFRISNI